LWWTKLKVVAAVCLALGLLGSGSFLLVRAGAQGEGGSGYRLAAPGGDKGKPGGKGGKQRGAPRIPLDRKRLLEASRLAGRIVVGRVVKADLSPGWWSGWAMCTREVTYEVTRPLKGKPGKRQTVEYLILKPRGEVEADSPRLDPRLFANGAEHLVCSGT